jgi:hypothetical protein
MNTSQEHLVPQIMELANRRFLGRADGNSSGARKSSVIPWLRARVPATLQNAIARLVPVSVRDSVVNHSIIDGHDWNQTPGFPILADLNAYLRLNVAGRESGGMLDALGKVLAHYREFLASCFRSFRVLDSGEPLVRDVLYADEHFPGARSAYLPDVIVTWTGGPPAKAIRSDAFGTIHAEIATGRGGNHRSDGFCIELRAGQSCGTAAPVHIAELGGLAASALRLEAGVGRA